MIKCGKTNFIDLIKSFDIEKGEKQEVSEDFEEAIMKVSF